MGVMRVAVKYGHIKVKYIIYLCLQPNSVQNRKLNQNYLPLLLFVKNIVQKQCLHACSHTGHPYWCVYVHVAQMIILADLKVDSLSNAKSTLLRIPLKKSTLTKSKLNCSGYRIDHDANWTYILLPRPIPTFVVNQSILSLTKLM